MAYGVTMLDRFAPTPGQILLADAASSSGTTSDGGGRIHLLGISPSSPSDSLGDGEGSFGWKVCSWQCEDGGRPNLMAQREGTTRGSVKSKHAQAQWGATTREISGDDMAIWFSSGDLTAMSHPMLDAPDPLSSFASDGVGGSGQAPWRVAEGSGGVVFRVSHDWLEVCTVRVGSPECRLPIFHKVVEQGGWEPPRPPVLRAYAPASGEAIALLSGPGEGIAVWLGIGHSPEPWWTSRGVSGLSSGAEISDLAFVASDRMLLGIDANGDVTGHPLTGAAGDLWRWRSPSMRAGAFPSSGARHRLAASPGGETAVAGFVSGLVAVLTLDAVGGLRGTRIVGCGPSELRGPLVVAPGGHTLVTGHTPPLVWRLDGDEPSAWCLAAGGRSLAAAAVGRAPSWGAFLLEDGEFGSFDASVPPDRTPLFGAGSVACLLGALPEVQRRVAEEYASLFSRPGGGHLRAAARAAKRREVEFVGMTAGGADYLARMAVLDLLEITEGLIEGEEKAPSSLDSDAFGSQADSSSDGPSLSYDSLDNDSYVSSSQETESVLGS